MILLSLFNILVETIYFLFFPLLYLFLKQKNYVASIKAEGEDIHKGILFHSASMGELTAIKALVTKHLQEHPEVKLCITTSTVTSCAEANKISPKVKGFLSVLDLPHLRNRQLKRINPGLICIVETEIWPNMLLWAKRNKVPVLFLNARMSKSTLRGYRLLKFLFRHLQSPITEIHAQSKDDAKRYRKIFNRPVYVSGNLKFSLTLKDYNAEELRKKWGYKSDDFIICWGSSRPGEEALLISLYPSLKEVIPNLHLIIGLRHPRRLEEVLELMDNYSYSCFTMRKEYRRAEDILIIDTLGILDQAYCICDIAIVGGSFYDFGGHNPLEPAYYKKPVVIGPHHYSCKESVKKLKVAGGIIISNKDDLLADLIALYKNKELREKMGKAAKKVLTENAHTLDIYLKALEKWLKEE